MSKKILGIDIRSASATAVLLETGLKKSTLTGHINAPFPKDGDFADRLSVAMQTISQGMDLSECTCLVTVPSSRFCYRSAAVPFTDIKKIRQMLPYELESAVPYPVEDLLIDFIKTKLAGGDGETKLLVAGAQISGLQTILSTIESFGIKPVALTPGGYPQTQWLAAHSYAGKDFLFVDLDGSDCALYLALAGEIVLIRSFPLSIRESLSAKTLWGHIQKSLAGFESLHEIKVSPSTMVLNGFEREGFAREMETVSSISVSPLDIPSPEGADWNINSSPSGFNGGLACALVISEGVSGMNFRKGPLASKGRLAEYRQGLIRTSIIAGILVCIWFAGMLTETRLLQKKFDGLQAEIRTVFQTTFPDVQKIVDPVQQMRTKIEALKSASLMTGDTDAQMKTVDILLRISQSIPAEMDVRVSKLNLVEDGILITGSTDSYAAPEEIKTRLSKVEGFYSVQITSADKESDGSRVRFKIKIQTVSKEVS